MSQDYVPFEPDEPNIVNRAIRGAGLMSAGTYTTAALRFGVGIGLARMIEPRFFGQFGIAIATVAILSVLLRFGQNEQVLNRRDDYDRFVSTQIGFRLISNSILLILVAVVWLLFSIFGNSSQGLYIFAIAAAAMPANVISFFNTHSQGQLLFGRLVFIRFAAPLIGSIVAISLALAGHTVWALLWLLMAESITEFVLTYLLAVRRFRPAFHREYMLTSFRFGFPVFWASLATTSYAKIDDLVVGAFSGERALGIYGRGYALASLVQSLFGAGIQSAIAPVYARIKEDRARAGRGIEFAMGTTLRVAAGLYFVLAITAPDVIELLYGASWAGVAPIMRIILPFAVVGSTKLSIQQIMLMIGDPKLLAKLEILQLLMLAVLMWPAIYIWGPVGVAGAVSASAVVGFVALIYTLKKYADFSARRVLGKPFISAIAGALVLLATSAQLELEDYSIVLRLMIEVMLYIVGYVISMILFDRQFIGEFLSRFKQGNAR